MGIKKIVGRKVGIGRFAVPVWAVGAAVALVGAAAGQAVGPVLSGSTTGSVNLTVAQAITLDTDVALGSNPLVVSADDAATSRNDEGTNFTVAAELDQGQVIYVNIYLQNHSGADGAATLQLNVPAGIDVDLEEFSNGTPSDSSIVDEARLNPNTWLLKVGAGAGTGDNDGIYLTIEPKDDLAPGFYTITGRIIQISG